MPTEGKSLGHLLAAGGGYAGAGGVAAQLSASSLYRVSPPSRYNTARRRLYTPDRYATLLVLDWLFVDIEVFVSVTWASIERGIVLVRKCAVGGDGEARRWRCTSVASKHCQQARL